LLIGLEIVKKNKLNDWQVLKTPANQKKRLVLSIQKLIIF